MSVVCLESLTFGLGHLVRAADTLGERLVLLTRYPSWYTYELERLAADALDGVEADTFDVERVAEVLRRTSDVRGLISSTELSQPALADVPAVRNKRFVVLPLTATLAGVRSAYAVGDLARGIHPESFE